MSILISHTVDKFRSEPYDKVFSEYGPVYFGIHDFDDEKNFLDGRYINFLATRPSNINNEFIEYAETYEKNTEELYRTARKAIFDKYCYFLTRINGAYLGGIYDYLYYFRIHVKAAARFLDENQIKFVILGLPAGGFDNILWHVAKEMGICRIGLFQAHNDRFFWLKDLNDMGTFSTSLPIFQSQNIQVQKKISDPFYMAKYRKPKLKKKSYFLLKDILRPLYYATSLCKMILKHNFNIKIYKPTDWLFSANKSRFLSQKYIQKTSNLLRSTLEKDYISEKNQSIKIILFLKVQPEAKEAFGDLYYDDQLLIIDKLQNISSHNAEIYIKEHPAERINDSMSRANFWNSISKKKNIFVLPADKKSSSLLNSFDIVATADGTIGWEAIRNFKPVICFEKPWYLSMPGVFEANKISNLERILKEKWTLEDINKTFTNLTKKMGFGYIIHTEKGYINSSDAITNFEYLTDEQKKKKLLNNDEVVADSFYKIFLNTYLKQKK